ncbi:MAG: VOC family protein [Pseudomonadota bacterium]
MKRRNFLSALAAASVSAGTISQTAFATDSKSNAIGLIAFDHMSLNVENFDNALKWYTEKLGLELEVSWKVGALDGKQLAYLTLNGNRVLEIVAADENGTGLKTAKSFPQHFGRTGYGHLCFSTDNADATMTLLREKGVEAFVRAETYPLDGTVFERRVAFIQDMEGNVVEFGEPLREKRA